MQSVEWNELFAVGDPLIDAQHRQLFEIYGLLAKTPSAGTQEAVITAVVKAVVTHADQHFRDEMIALRQLGAEDWKTMRDQHTILAREIRAIDATLTEKPAAEVLAAFKTWFFERLMPHLIYSDKAAFERATKINSKGKNKAPKGSERRKLFLLRLVVSQLSSMFPEKAKGKALRRRVIPGIDLFLRKALGEVVYDRLNKTAQRLLESFETEDEGELWVHLHLDPEGNYFLTTLQVRILAYFDDYEHGKKTFINMLDAGFRDADGFVSEAEFAMIFNGLFKGIFKEVESDDVRVELDYRFGLGTSEKILRIKKQFLKEGGLAA